MVDKLGRRPLLIFSQFMMTFCLGATGTFFIIKRHFGPLATKGLDWLPVTSLGTFIAAFAFGVGPVSYMIQGEILPPEAKGLLKLARFKQIKSQKISAQRQHFKS